MTPSQLQARMSTPIIDKMASNSNERAQSEQKFGINEKNVASSQDRSINRSRPRIEQSQESVGSTESTKIRNRFNRKVKGIKDLKYGYKFTTSLDVNRGENNSALKRQKVYRENNEERQNRQNLLEIKRIILTAKHQRQKDEQLKLSNYFQQIKIFKDILIDDNDAFEALTGCIQLIDVDSDTTLFNEGEEGELFYIIIQGEVEVLKSSHQVIEFDQKISRLPMEKRSMKDKIKAFYQAFLKYYDQIFWPDMDISQDEVDQILGIEGTNQNLDYVKPLNDWRKGILQSYIQRREDEGTFTNYEGESVILVSKRLVILSRGAGFGELALMSSVKRMASVRAVTDSCFAILTRQDFSVVMRKAQKRKIAEQVEFLQRFPFFDSFTQIKLQKLFYLLEKRTHLRNKVLFKQGDIIDGIYLISEGELQYQAKAEVYSNDFGKSNWISPEILHNNQNKTVSTRVVAEFSLNEIVGFEEVMRQKILDELRLNWELDPNNQHYRDKEEKANSLFHDQSTKLRNFTCAVKSLSATLYFLKIEDFKQFYKFIPTDQVRRGVKTRMDMLKRQIGIIQEISTQDYKKKNRSEAYDTHRGQLVLRKKDSPTASVIQNMLKKANGTKRNQGHLRSGSQDDQFHLPSVQSARLSVNGSYDDLYDSQLNEKSVQFVSQTLLKQDSNRNSRMNHDSADRIQEIRSQNNAKYQSTLQVGQKNQQSNEQILQQKTIDMKTQSSEVYKNQVNYSQNKFEQKGKAQLRFAIGSQNNQKNKPGLYKLHATEHLNISARHHRNKNMNMFHNTSFEKIVVSSPVGDIVKSNEASIFSSIKREIQTVGDQKRQTSYMSQPSGMKLSSKQDTATFPKHSLNQQETPINSAKSLQVSIFNTGNTLKQKMGNSQQPYNQSAANLSPNKGHDSINGLLTRQSHYKQQFSTISNMNTNMRYLHQGVTFKAKGISHNSAHSIEFVRSKHQPLSGRISNFDGEESQASLGELKVQQKRDSESSEEKVQKNFIKYPDSKVHDSRSLQNYVRLKNKDQYNLSRMRKAEQNAVQRKAQVINLIEDEAPIELKMNQVFHSKDPQGDLTYSNNAKLKFQHIKREQLVLESGQRSVGNSSIVTNQRNFPTQKTANNMRVETYNNKQSDTEVAKNSQSVDEIMTRQLNTRLTSILHDISSKHYDRQEHKKRLEIIQNDLDKKYDIKQQHVRLKVNHHMTGPAFKKIIARKQQQRQEQSMIQSSIDRSIESFSNSQSIEYFDQQRPSRELSDSQARMSSMQKTTQYPFIAQESHKKNKSYHSKQTKKPSTGSQNTRQTKIMHTSLVKLAAMNLDSERKNLADELFGQSNNSSLRKHIPRNTNNRTQGGHRNHGTRPHIEESSKATVPTIISQKSQKKKQLQELQSVSLRVRHPTEGEQQQENSSHFKQNYANIKKENLLNRFMQDREFKLEPHKEKERQVKMIDKGHSRHKTDLIAQIGQYSIGNGFNETVKHKSRMVPLSRLRKEKSSSKKGFYV